VTSHQWGGGGDRPNRWKFAERLKWGKNKGRDGSQVESRSRGRYKVRVESKAPAKRTEYHRRDISQTKKKSKREITSKGGWKQKGGPHATAKKEERA